MKFKRNIKVEWYDTDAGRTVSPSRMMVYMMETANMQCEQYGFGLDKLRDDKGLGFILGGIQASFLKPLHTGDEITVYTWCRPARGYSFMRYFEIKKEGEVVARAASTWALLDIVNKSMVRGDESYDCFFLYDEPIDAALLPRRARTSKKEMVEAGTRRIVYSDIDYNMHMNNTRYPNMLCDFLPDMNGKRLSALSMTYLREAPLGAELTVLRTEPLTPDSTGEFELRTLDTEGNTCLEAVVEVSNI